MEYVEKYGILEYTVKGNIITWYEKHKIDCFGTVKKYKYTHNVRTGKNTVKQLYNRTI